LEQALVVMVHASREAKQAGMADGSGRVVFVEGVEEATLRVDFEGRSKGVSSGLLLAWWACFLGEDLASLDGRMRRVVSTF
jgi:hypothetical protein